MKGVGDDSRSDCVQPIKNNDIKQQEKDYESISDASFDDLTKDKSVQDS